MGRNRSTGARVVGFDFTPTPAPTPWSAPGESAPPAAPEAATPVPPPPMPPSMPPMAGAMPQPPAPPMATAPPPMPPMPPAPPMPPPAMAAAGPPAAPPMPPPLAAAPPPPPAPPGYGVPGYPSSMPPAPPAPPGYGAAPAFPPPGYPAAPTSGWGHEPAGAPVATMPPPAGPPPGMPGAFPAPAFTPPATGRRRTSPKFLAAAAVVIVVLVAVANGVRAAGEGASTPRRPVAAPAAPLKLAVPAKIGTAPRMTTPSAKKFEREARQGVPARFQPTAAWYGRGPVPTYEIRALTAGLSTSKEVLAQHQKMLAADVGVKFGPATRVPGGMTCAKMRVAAMRGSLCAWSGDSKGLVLWYAGDNLHQLSKATVVARAQLERR